MYTSDGRLQGTGTQGTITASMIAPWAPIAGDWSSDDNGRICTSMRVGTSVGTSVMLPKRCQYWYKLGKEYYFADSDTDRSAKVLSRTIKK